MNAASYTYEDIREQMGPDYRQILPIMNLFKTRNANLGDKIDYSQRKGNNLSTRKYLVQRAKTLL